MDAKQISIEGYQPRLLGNTDDEAWQGLKRRIDGLIAFSAERAERALPLVSSPNPDRAAVEPIILESALESARVTADLLYTVFTLSLRPADPPGAELTGTAVVPPLPGNDDQQVRIVLLNTDYATLATLPDGSGPEERSYRFAFRNLPTGQYQVLAYRPGAQTQVLEASLKPGVSVHGRTAPRRDAKRIARAADALGRPSRPPLSRHARRDRFFAEASLRSQSEGKPSHFKKRSAAIAS